MTQGTNIGQMYMQTLFSEDISAATYYIESGEECALIDPVLVQTDKINAILQKRGKQLKNILLTHIPTSYISGYLEYQNVDVAFGPGVEAAEGLRNLKENETINLGDLTISYETTGHFSTECVCFIVSNKGGQNICVFGGADFIYGGGLLPQIGNQAQAQIHPKFDLKIKQDIKIFPAYGASGYYKYIKDQSTIRTVSQVLNGPKIDFSVGPYIMSQKRSDYIRKTNLLSPFSYKSTKETCSTVFGIEQFDQLRANAMILDIRQDIPQLEKGSIPNSYVIPPNGNIGLFIYFLINADKPALVICKKELRQSLINRLLNIGCSNILGFNDFTLQQWIDSNKQFYLPLFTGVKDVQNTPNNLIIDCRTPTQWKQQGVMQNSKQIYFPHIEQNIEKNKQQYKKYDKIYVYCRLGFRARIGACMFTHAGFKNTYIVPQTFVQIKNLVKTVPYQQ